MTQRREPGAVRSLVTGAVLGTVLGVVLVNLSTALVELDESRTLGAACEHVEATLVGAPSGLLIGTGAAAVYYWLRRHVGSVVLSLLGALAGAVVALLVIVFLLYPLATQYLPIFVCAY